jgi:vitamin B12 transporter
MDPPVPGPYLALGVLLWSCALQAQTISPGPISPGGQDPIVVTVSGKATPIETTSASVTLLQREFIESSHAASAADLLREVPFLYLDQSGASGGLASVTVRGSKPNFVLVMIDGIPVNDITNFLGGSFDFSQLALDNIEQVEIVRGPLSSVYGSDAIGAVINFVSRRGDNAQPLEIAGEGGSFASREMRISSGWTSKAFQYSFSASYLDVGEQVYKDPYSLGNAALHATVALGPRRILDVTVRYDEKQSAGLPANGGGREFAILRDPFEDHLGQFVIGATYRAQLKKWWSYSLQADRFTSGDNNVTPAILDAIPPGRGTEPSSRSVSRFERTRTGATSDLQIHSALSLQLRAGLRRENGSTAGELNGNIPSSYRLSRQILDSSAEVTYTPGHLSTSAGLAVEKPEGLDVVVSPRVGATYPTSTRGPRLRASWAEGFKLPSFYSLGNPLVGNRELKPEYSRALDVGVEQRFAGATASVTYFWNRFTNLIDFSSLTFQLVNRTRAYTQGLEFQADAPAGWRLRPGMSASYVGWRLEGTSEPLRDVPHLTGGVHLAWSTRHQVSGRIATEWIGRRYDFSVPEPQIQFVRGYSDTNAAVRYRVNAQVSLYARADNLLNSKFQDHIGFPNPGIAARIGVNYSPFAR